MEYLGDQGRDLVIVSDFLQNGNLFFIGPQTSIGDMYLGPFYYYLIAPFLFLYNFNPVGPAIFVAVLSIITTYLLYLIGKKYFHLQVGLLSALLFAISPVVIKYSNFSWNPNIMPLFSLLFVYFLLESKYLYASLAFIFCLNSHYLALILLPLGFLIVLPRFNHNKLKELGLSIFVFILSLTPQILFDLKHQGQNTKAFLRFFTYRESTVSIKPYKALPKIPVLFNQINTRLLAGKNINFGIITSVYFFIGILLTFFRNRYNFRFNYLILWYLLGIVFLGLYKQHIYDHYFGFLFPVVFLLFSVVSFSLFQLNPYTKAISTIFIILVILFSVLENPWRYPPNRQLATNQEIVSSIIKASDGQPFNFALLAKQNYDPPYRYLFSRLKAPLEDTHQKITDQLFVACEPWQIDCQPINNPQWEVASFGWAKIVDTWEINGIKVFKLVHND